ncbi:hypothetical protein ACFQJ7_09210 [Halovenus rubra]|uniref:Uncharacterized protein n=2 Tax=Halovenus rubra TaxID=869890 RepID=A0ABD5XCU5_9EURY|nr:hypothetical protein [Halovenus rubra]
MVVPLETHGPSHRPDYVLASLLLQSALQESHADPETFRAENNPEVWETTCLDGKKVASDQRLNEMAAGLRGDCRNPDV